MRSSEAEGSEPSGWGLDDLQILAALGFGPDSVLMNGPKLFVDGPFLAALQQELLGELGEDEAHKTLFHIGVIHGLRDAERIGSASPGEAGGPGLVECPPVGMSFGSPATSADDGGLELAGSWPDAFEAEARLGSLGQSRTPSCALSAGYTSGWLSGTLDRDVRVVETRCRASGDASCSFEAREESAADRSGPALAIAALRAVALSARTNALRDSATADLREALPDLDPSDPAVHIWGPVMVMPFVGADSAMQTIEMLGLDESTHCVRVVVVDLGGELVDPGFGAAAVERVLEEIQSWGAEVILTGICPASEEVVAELQASLMLVRKDLSEAIAYAFQVADAQRHLL